MDFRQLHKKHQQLQYAEALVKHRPTMEGIHELKKFRKENKRTKLQAVANE